jgi:hypothetical protein
MKAFDVEVHGTEEIRKALDRVPSEGSKKLLRKMVLFGERRTKQMSPVDTGRLRASIRTDMDAGAVPQWASWLSNANYARFVEFGTKPHFPPTHALEGWGKRHGIAPFLVARKIARRGTRPKLMFSLALQELNGKVSGMVADVEKQMQKSFEEKTPK